ncbi:hypothetical protein D3C72_1896880 [compost metagenome]
MTSGIQQGLDSVEEVRGDQRDVHTRVPGLLLGPLAGVVLDLALRVGNLTKVDARPQDLLGDGRGVPDVSGRVLHDLTPGRRTPLGLIGTVRLFGFVQSVPPAQV